MPDIACVPPIDACGIENPDQPGHYCDVEIGHRSWHECEHHQWHREAACVPADSSWRKLARVAQRMLGVAA